MSTEPTSDYHIVVNGGDNLGYVDSETITIRNINFDYPEDTNKVEAQYIEANLKALEFDTNLVANKLAEVNLSNVSVKKAGIELGVDQVNVKMEYNGTTYTLFHGTPTDKKANFIVGDFSELYGKKDVTIKVELYSQAVKLSKTYSNATYTPQFSVRGKVYNTASGTKVTSVLVDGQSVNLDENDEFSFIVDSLSESYGLSIQAEQNSALNHFDPVSTDLTYDSPSKYIVLVGEDGRPSPSITISPTNVSSGEFVTFTLTSNENIPSNTVISLDEANCNAAQGLGSKQVTMACTMPNTTSIKYILMTIASSEIYGGSIVRTIIVDPALEDSDSDGDGIPDDEDAFPNDPNEWLDTDGDGTGNNADPDDDNDGMSDEYENQYNLDPLDASDANEDADGDGLTNLEEYDLGTKPNNPDSDGDGINDGDEVEAGTDPAEMNSDTTVLFMILMERNRQLYHLGDDPQ